MLIIKVLLVALVWVALNMAEKEAAKEGYIK